MEIVALLVISICFRAIADILKSPKLLEKSFFSNIAIGNTSWLFYAVHYIALFLVIHKLDFNTMTLSYAFLLLIGGVLLYQFWKNLFLR